MSAETGKKNGDIDEQRKRPNQGPCAGPIGNIHHDVGHAQHHEQQGKNVQPGLSGLQLVGNDDRRKEKRQGLEGVGLGRVGPRAPIGLPCQPGTRVVVVITAFTPLGPLAAMTPNSARCPRRALINIVLCRTRRSRTLCSMSTDCCSTVFTATNRMVGRVTASQIASASAASVFPRFT